MLGPYSKKHWKLWLKNGAGATVAGPSTEQIDKLQGFLLCNGVYAKPGLWIGFLGTDPMLSLRVTILGLCQYF